MNVINCLFCQIANKDIESTIVYEDPEVLAFLDVNPKSKGHTLLIPKNHYSRIEDKKDNIDFIEKIKLVVEELHKDYDFKDFNLEVNNGPNAGQEIQHLHFHIIPVENEN